MLRAQRVSALLCPVLGALLASASPARAQVKNYGGRVVEQMAVVQVLYGQGQYLPQVVALPPQTGMGTFYDAFLNSPYVDWLGEYNTFGTASTPSQPIRRGGYFYTQVQIFPLPANNGSVIDDGNIQAELIRQIQNGVLPGPYYINGNDEVYYDIFFPPNKTITRAAFKTQSCLDFCSYHWTMTVPGRGEIYYGVHPDMQQATGGECYEGCYNFGPTQFDVYTEAVSHELVEVLTDAEAGFAPSVASPLAWYDPDPNGGEIADLCQGNIAALTSQGATYQVSMAYSNSNFVLGSQGCIASRPLATRFYGSPTNYWWNSPFYGVQTFLGDVNGDRRADLVGLGNGYVGVIESTGTVGWNFGGYQTWSSTSFFGVNGTLVGPLSNPNAYGGSFNADLVALNNGSVTVRLSTGGAFGPVQTWWNNSFFGANGNTFLGDVNCDGFNDLVGAGNGYVGVIPNNYGTGFGSYETWLGTTFIGGVATFVVDVNGDGCADMLAVDGASFSVRLSNGSTFGSATTYNGAAWGPYGTLVGDVNCDGLPDIVAVSGGSISVILNQGSGFGSPQVWYDAPFIGQHGTLLGDINGDGCADVVALNNGSVSALLAAP
jgi:hypothetical protein